jgi:hypothetical protein
MQHGRLQKSLIILTVCIAVGLMSAASFAKEAVQEYELVNPAGVVKVEPMKVNPHPSTLEGKTVVLRINVKHNADNALDRVAELLQQQVKNVKIIKAWEVLPETRVISQGADASVQVAKKIAGLKPDLVIAAQAD